MGHPFAVVYPLRLASDRVIIVGVEAVGPIQVDWNMSPLNKGSNESRAATHEKRFLKQAFECIKANHTGASVDAIYAPGLVSSRHTMHLRDSADGVVMLTDTEGDLPSC
ncbi:hypothetical protein THAOC_37393 [Thalassiosira oceanica]|uniref:Uncharacterized protein n=1 Tax=Thalassiosira oceanica TaxID=159749 RepID=K0QYF2_THAOC|nr:hypothetical protein THAOC_37393 [Thalassiosira oceanica]|eukprot:EJK44098.1 hypothetical protein THAOC_37393 [Thalassiosira oceanica]